MGTADWGMAQMGGGNGRCRLTVRRVFVILAVKPFTCPPLPTIHLESPKPPGTGSGGYSCNW